MNFNLYIVMPNKSNKEFFTKASVVELLRKSHPEIDIDVLNQVSDIFFDTIVTALVCGDRVELRKFGSWVVRKRAGKTVRNPRTNEKIVVGDKGSLYFRASKDIIKSLNNFDQKSIAKEAH